MDSKPESGDESAQWRQLVAQCDLLRAAAQIAWTNMVEAYKVAAADPTALDPEQAVIQYRSAKALQAAAEATLLQYMESRRNKANGP
jgi:hypothetical protein